MDANSAVENGDGTKWSTAFKTIQRGIDAAKDGDKVTVAQGTYVENIFFDGKNITLTGTEPLDPDVIANTIIDGNQVGSVVTFSGSEAIACVLTGFTIRNGKSTFGGGICGGTSEGRSRATIRNNVIVGNAATKGAGIAFCDGLIQGNVVIENSAQWGGGLAFCDDVISVNLIAGNFAELGGGGLAYCNGEIESNTITGNLSDGGGGLYECKGTIQNCIIWRNMAWYGVQLHASSVPTFSCIEDWMVGGEGNISEDPLFVDADGLDDNPSTYGDNNYRLSTSSPCVDAGANADWMWDAVDLDGNPRVLYGGFSLAVDIGAYEFVLFGPYNALTVVVYNKHNPPERPAGAVIRISPIVGSVKNSIFSAYVPVGKYEIHASAPCFSPEVRSTEVTIESPATVVIYLSPNPGSVSGRVISGDDGAEITGVTVQLEVTSGVLTGTAYETVTDTGGTFSVSDHPAAIDYQITFSKTGYFKHQAIFFLSACEAKNLNTISLTPSISIVRDSAGSFTITWKSVSGMLYKVYYGDIVGDWNLAASGIQASPTGKNSWTDDDASWTVPPPSSARIRFYRVEAY